MTTSDEPTLGALILPGTRALSEKLANTLDTSEEAAEIKAALAKAVPGLPLGPIIESVSKALQDALDVPISSVLGSAWNRARELRAAIRETRDSDKAAVLVPLLNHTITSEHRPYVDVMVSGAAIARLVFPLKLALQVEGAVLRVANGRMTDVMAGQLKGKATLKFAEFVLFDKALSPIPIPATLTLERAAA
jgi:hypothetical protein